MAIKNRFYLACFRDNVGSNMGFYAANGIGYTTNIDRAQVYTREEAQNVWASARGYDQPISADHVDAAAIYKVDSQHIPAQPSIPDGVELFAAFAKSKWDGNDVFWLSPIGVTADFSDASQLTRNQLVKVSNDFVIIPYAVADSQKRRTFAHELFNPRTMVQGAGLVLPDHIKRERRAKDSAKTRWNCPACGKINWQYNPYDFEGCSDRACEEHCH